MNINNNPVKTWKVILTLGDNSYLSSISPTNASGRHNKGMTYEKVSETNEITKAKIIPAPVGVHS